MNLTMDWELVKPWANRLGIVLEFLLFFLAAPEMLGEERLKALERRAERGPKYYWRTRCCCLWCQRRQRGRRCAQWWWGCDSTSGKGHK